MTTLYGVVAIFMWSGLALLGVYTSAIPTFQLLFLCFSISALLLPLTRMLKGQAAISRPRLGTMQCVVGVGGLFGFHCCYFLALKSAPAIEVSLISYLWPMLLALLTASRRTFFSALFGSLLGFSAIVVLISSNFKVSFSSEYIVGYFYAACCALIWSGYSWFQSTSNGSSEDMSWLCCMVAGLSLVAHLQLEEGYWQLSISQIVSVLLLGFGPVGGAFYCWDIGLKRGNKALLASLSFATPIISTIALLVAGISSGSSGLSMALILLILGVLLSNFHNISITKIRRLRR